VRARTCTLERCNQRRTSTAAHLLPIGNTLFIELAPLLLQVRPSLARSGPAQPEGEGPPVVASFR
jgi:hypothetical protein